MRYVPSFISDEQKELEGQYVNGESHAIRIRCQAILLSHQEYSQVEIAKILSVHRNTVSTWLTCWGEGGMKGLQPKPGRGRKPKLPIGNLAEEGAICAIIEQYPQQMKKICLELEVRYGYPISADIVKRYAKKKAIVGNVSVAHFAKNEMNV